MDCWRLSGFSTRFRNFSQLEQALCLCQGLAPRIPGQYLVLPRSGIMLVAEWFWLVGYCRFLSSPRFLGLGHSQRSAQRFARVCQSTLIVLETNRRHQRNDRCQVLQKAFWGLVCQRKVTSERRRKFQGNPWQGLAIRPRRSVLVRGSDYNCGCQEREPGLRLHALQTETRLLGGTRIFAGSETFGREQHCRLKCVWMAAILETFRTHQERPHANNHNARQLFGSVCRRLCSYTTLLRIS